MSPDGRAQTDTVRHLISASTMADRQAPGQRQIDWQIVRRQDSGR
jgi:hypothetical protein